MDSKFKRLAYAYKMFFFVRKDLDYTCAFGKRAVTREKNSESNKAAIYRKTASFNLISWHTFLYAFSVFLNSTTCLQTLTNVGVRSDECPQKPS